MTNKIPLCAPMMDEEMKKAAMEVLDSKRYINGPKAEEFENAFAKYCNVKYATTVSNGTAALYVALRAIDIKRRDEIIVPSHTFISTASTVVLAGAKPVFVDIDDSYNMDMDDFEKRITERTKAVIPVHLYGQMCDMNKLMELKEKHDFYVIEDACQAHGAEYNGKRSGSFGDVGCFSFYPSKNMTVAGDGGIIVTNNEELHMKSNMIRDHGRDWKGKEGKYTHKMLGFNFRLSEVLAAIGIEQLKKLDGWIKRRRDLASLYNKLLTNNVVKPVELENRKHVYYLYVIRSERRDELKKFLLDKNVNTGIHYPVPLHKQPIFLPNDFSLPKVEAICKEILSLPMFPGLKDEEVEYVCESVNTFKGD